MSPNPEAKDARRHIALIRCISSPIIDLRQIMLVSSIALSVSPHPAAVAVILYHELNCSNLKMDMEHKTARNPR
jgi:hypothetical protein